MKKHEYVMTLCAGRHETPAQACIFKNISDPTDLDSMWNEAWDNIPENCTDLTVYVTGLTVAMLTVVSVCNQRGITLTARHYNAMSGNYYDQPLTQYTECPFCHGRVQGYDGYLRVNYCPHCGAT